MASYKLTPKAQSDLKDIWRTIAEDNAPAADRLLMRWFEKFELAADNPDMGSPRPELSADARLLVEGRYIAIYEPQPYGIDVIALIYGGREPKNWL